MNGATSKFNIDADGLVAFTQALVRVRSVHDAATSNTEGQAAALVEAKMRSFGWDPEVIEIEPGRPNVIAVLHGNRPGPTLMFEGHTDVVTEGDLSEWTFDPYGAEIRDGKLLGRGSADMKSGLAAMIYAARAVERAGDFPGTLVVGALADEEGMMIGAKAFAGSSLALGVDGAIICEPEDGEICNVAKGAIRMKVIIKGKMAHGAMPQHGRNPIPVAAAIISKLAALQDELQKEHGEHPTLGDIYLTPTVLDGGDNDQINVIPTVCSLAADIRTTTAVDHPTLLSHIHSLVDQSALEAGCEATFVVIDDRPPVDTPIDDPVVAALAAAHERVTGGTPVYGGVPGTTDGTILTRDAAIPTVVYGPGDKWIAHQANEWVSVEDIVINAHVYAEAAAEFLNSDIAARKAK
ncbi:succinyl-diaminopimelate desuccinylase [Antricoccus suffuscus]|uniref:Probable succinyl-diaminopimelate desuccinylase n=1 Tax=Antricoccus suffuscus TaxID=1629062 RepID=A0A2T1A6E5_9ACTN|nr:M20 family metallopeptidase [Antricoccus suffuscus]PRZ44185.1 succinyl-diaminopimelate desuccinylase [Antricoccus suffuscus]